MRTHFIVTNDYLRKSLIISYFLKNSNLLKLFDFRPDEFVEEIMGFDSYQAYAMSVNEFIKVMEVPRNSTPVELVNTFSYCNPHHISSETFSYYIFFGEENFKTLRELYKGYAKRRESLPQSDMIDFIESIHKNPKNIDLLNKMVFYVDPVHRVLTLSRILLDFRSEILNRALPGWPEEFDFEFLKCYIRNFNLRKLHTYQGITSFAVMTIYDKQNDSEFEHLGYIKGLFDQLPIVDGFVSTESLILKIRNDEFLGNFSSSIIRKGNSKKTSSRNLAGETFQDLLDRVESESESWIDWGEFRQYFTRRGFPM
jgi:hypothetical protein